MFNSYLEVGDFVALDTDITAGYWKLARPSAMLCHMDSQGLRELCKKILESM